MTSKEIYASSKTFLPPTGRNQDAGLDRTRRASENAEEALKDDIDHCFVLHEETASYRDRRLAKRLSQCLEIHPTPSMEAG
jgi:hypothetical protein